MIRRSVLSGSTRKKQKRFKDNLWKIIRKAGGILLKTTLKIRQKSGSSVAKYREEWSDSRLLLSKFLTAKFCHQVFCTSYRISCNIGNCLTPTLSKENMSNNNKRPQHYLHFTLHTDQVKTPFMKAETVFVEFLSANTFTV